MNFLIALSYVFSILDGNSHSETCRRGIRESTENSKRKKNQDADVAVVSKDAQYCLSKNLYSCEKDVVLTLLLS